MTSNSFIFGSLCCGHSRISLTVSQSGYNELAAPLVSQYVTPRHNPITDDLLTRKRINKQCRSLEDEAICSTWFYRYTMKGAHIVWVHWEAFVRRVLAILGHFWPPKWNIQKASIMKVCTYVNLTF